MIEYLGESKIDGYPIIKIYQSKEYEVFMEHFNRLKIPVSVVAQLEDFVIQEKPPELPDYFVLKIHMPVDYFKRQLMIYERYEKLKKING